MTLPLWLYPLLGIACFVALMWHEDYCYRRDVENFRQSEAERIARENTRPDGNVERVQ